MASTTTNIHGTRKTRGLRDLVAAFLGGLGRGLVAYGDRQSRRDQIIALEAKSDEQLAAMGLSRADITRYVFRDLYYI